MKSRNGVKPDASDSPYVTQCSAERAELAEQEERLLEALVAHGARPESIEASQIDASARSLFRKRFRAIRNHNQATTVSEEEHQQQLRYMEEYALIHPGSHPDGICADAAHFSRFIEAKIPSPRMTFLARVKSGILRKLSLC